MNTWTLDITGQSYRTIIGGTANAAASRAAALRAIATANAAAGFHHHRYEAAVDPELLAIIQTGIDEAGLPDHRGIVDLLDRIANATQDHPTI
jgi:hypothetical protein